ncbi:ribosome small subunit-dependent GTPase A [bacterium]|nr:ribosome small subunit-dependent GTPase A [bacterium]
MPRGLVTKIEGNNSWVLPWELVGQRQTGPAIEGSVRCFLPKSIRREARHTYTTALAVGDRVEIEPAGDIFRIVAVQQRKRVLSRRNLTDRAPVEDVIVANPDRLLAVVSFAEPAFHTGLLDRFLCSAETDRIPAAVIGTKADLLDDCSRADELLAPYSAAGYRTLVTSVVSGRGVEYFLGLLGKVITLLAGESGVGKSSLLNAIQPGFQLKTDKISDFSGKGKHVTSVIELLPLAGGFVADTPGIREFGLWGVSKGGLGDLFPELRKHSADCRFRDCLHVSEPDCAIKEGVGDGTIARSRYEGYLSILETLPAKIHEKKTR